MSASDLKSYAARLLDAVSYRCDWELAVSVFLHRHHDPSLRDVAGAESGWSVNASAAARSELSYLQE